MYASLGRPKSKHWMKHMAVAPKGLLRYYVLELLSEEYRSGSEIMDLIEEGSRGLWRPSPGSIYPLLEWLKEKGYIREVGSEGASARRYTLTEKGKKLLEEQREVKAFMMKTWRHFAPYFLDIFFFKNLTSEQHELLKTLRLFMQIFFTLQSEIWDRDNKEYFESMITIIKDATSKLEELKVKVERSTDG